MDDDDKLLKLAMGADPNKTYWLIIPDKKREYTTKRREARRGIFTIRKALKNGKEITDEKLKVLHELISKQLDTNFGRSYSTFTFAWDIHPRSLTKIILKEHWVKEGGGFNVDFGAHEPTAFTNQEE